MRAPKKGRIRRVERDKKMIPSHKLNYLLSRNARTYTYKINICQEQIYYIIYGRG